MDESYKLSRQQSEAADVLIGLQTEPAIFSLGLKPPEEENESIIDYSDIESVAEDDQNPELDEHHVFEEAFQAAEIPVQDIEWVPVFEKANGEQILKLTELYKPLAQTEAHYDKQNLLERVSKSNTRDKTRSKEDYNNYLKNLMEHKADLRREYKAVMALELVKVEEEDEKEKKNYVYRHLLKKVRKIDKEIREMEEYGMSREKREFRKLGKEFNLVKNQNFFDEIIWDGPKKGERVGISEKVAKIPVEDEIIRMKDKFVKKNKEVFFINDNNRYEERKDAKSLGILSSNQFRDPFMRQSPNFLMNSAPVELIFEKSKGKSPQISDFKKNPLLPPQSQSHWGEYPQNPFEFLTSDYNETNELFSIPTEEEPLKIPPKINHEFSSNNWLNLVFFDPCNLYHLELHKEYSKLHFNLNDPALIYSSIQSTSSSDHTIEKVHENPDDNKTLMSELLKPKTLKSSTVQPMDLEKYNQSTSTMLKHALPAYEYPFFKISWTKKELRSFHRPSFSVLSYFPIQIDTKTAFVAPQSPRDETRGEDITAYMTLKKPRHLSIKEGDFLVTEYIEELPPLLNNFGMSSKICKYFKGRSTVPYVGTLGLSVNLQGEQNIPLIAQLKDDQAISIIETNLFRAPCYSHTSRSNDFLLMRFERKNRVKYFLRPIEHLYTVAQMEPKVEVFAPNARVTNNFQQKRIQAFLYKALIESGNKGEIHEISKRFPCLSESAIRKHMKNIKCEIERDMTWKCLELPNDQEVKEMVTPELLCEYESMLVGQRLLKDKGIQITSIDKVPNAISKLRYEREERKIRDLAAYIEDQLVLTSWNLTSSYLKAKTENGMMRITGLGDPTHGNGGFSFVRLPMKQSNTEKVLNENDPSKYLPTHKPVTGTKADLRSLTKEESRKRLKVLGFGKDELMNKGRWELVDILRAAASREVEEGNRGSWGMFARGVRMNTKMQKEKCESTIDQNFQLQVRLLGETRDYKIETEVEDFDENFSGLTAIFSKENSVQNKEEDISEFQEKLMGKLNPFEFAKPAKIFARRKAVKRTTKIPNLDGTVTIKTVYLTDKEDIKEFESKEHEKKMDTKLKARQEKNKNAIELKLFCKEKKLKKQADYGTSEAKRVNFSSMDQRNISCGACGERGHIKTNSKKCPNYAKESQFFLMPASESMVKTDGNKIQLNLKQINDNAPRRREDRTINDDYSRPKTISSMRMRYLEENPYDSICHELIKADYRKIFSAPVRKDAYPDYYEIVKDPIDLSKIRDKAKRREYTSANLLTEDLDKMINNSVIYNGIWHEVTELAREIKEKGLKLLREKELLVEIPKEDKEEM